MYIETQSDETTAEVWPEAADAELVWAEPGFRIYQRPGGFFLAVGEKPAPRRPPSTLEVVDEILDAVLDAADQEILDELQHRDDLQGRELMQQLLLDAVLRYRQLRRQAEGGPASRSHRPPGNISHPPQAGNGR